MLLVVGRIGRPHGVRGEVTVEVRTDEPEQRFAVGSVLSTDPAAAKVASVVPATLTIEDVRWHQGRALVLFDGYYDRDLVENLRNVLLCVDSDDVESPADPDEFLDHELVGLSAVSPAGEVLGTVARIDHAPASDLLVVTRPGGGTALVPFVKAIVPTVDTERGLVTVTPPAGLFEDLPDDDEPDGASSQAGMTSGQRGAKAQPRCTSVGLGTLPGMAPRRLGARWSSSSLGMLASRPLV